MRIQTACKHLILSLGLSLFLWGEPVLALPQGDWQGEIELPGQKLQVQVRLSQDSQGQWSGQIDIPAQNARGLALQEIVLSNQTLRFQIAGIPGNPVFEGTLDAEERQLQGQFSQGGQRFPFQLRRPDPAQSAADAAAQQALLAKIRQMVSQRLQQWQTPGLALALVRDDQVLLAEGFGFRDQEKQLPVGADTLFAIGSCTKAFTATLLAQLQEQGVLDWDQPVKTWLPDFQLKDSYVTEHLTPRDLLSHTSGLPRHDLLWYGSELNAQGLYARLRELEFSMSFRQHFQYQNLMYLSAGLLAEKLTGESWAQLISRRFLQPLGMTRSLTSLEKFQQQADHARPYRKQQDKIQRISYRSTDAVAPAGSIYSSARDMAQWLRFNLNGGKIGDQSLLSPDSLQELHSPQSIMLRRGLYPEIPYQLYGMGWLIHPYRGHQVITHGGNIDGYSALVTLLPERRTGLVLLSNRDGDPLPGLLSYELADLLLGLEPLDWSTRFKLGLAQAERLKNSPDLRPRVAYTRPSHPLSEYTGRFSHPAYGELQIVSSGSGLALQFRNLGGPLEHWHYDSFVVRQREAATDGLQLQFETGPDGDLPALRLKLEPMTEALRFERQVPAEMLDPLWLKRYQGQYALSGLKVEIRLQGRQLVAQAQGQPTFVLEPQRRDVFRLKGLKDYSLRFEFAQDRVKRVIFTQPNGSFEAMPISDNPVTKP